MIRGVLLAKWLLMIASSLGYGREAGQLKCEDTTKLGRDDPIRERLANTIRLPGPRSASLVIFEGRTASEKALVSVRRLLDSFESLGFDGRLLDS
jgi:hypothetical protein